MENSIHNLNRLIAEIKKRWLARTLKQGFVVTALTFFLWVMLYILFVYLFDPSPLMQTIGLLTILIVLLAEILKYVIRPYKRRPSDQQIALFIEEKFPEMEDRINSAVEIENLSLRRERDVLIDKLIDDAAFNAQKVQISTVIDLRKERILTYALYGLLVLFLIFIYALKDELRFVSSKMKFSFYSSGELRQGIDSIVPGDTEVEKGESQEILVALHKKSDDDVILHYKIGNNIWQKETMDAGFDKQSFMYQFLSIQEPINYYIELEVLRSPEYTISLYEFPRVVQIDLKYSYPSYTGLPDKIEEDTGNIRGLKGSEVILTVTTSGAVDTGEIVVGGSQIIPLKSLRDGIFSGSLKLQDYGTYSIKLTDKEEKTNKFPEEYQITVIDDELPIIKITDPQRDVRVNLVEEVLLAAIIQDDYGVENVRLKYSVNGDDEQSVDFIDNDLRGAVDVSGSYVFYLEDFSLEAGDIISYYLEAEDNFHQDNPAMTDMYFIEIAPFDVQYTQMNNQQGGQQQQGEQQGGSQMVTSQQMIIAATWKLHRTRKEMTSGEFAESLAALIQGQQNLRDNIDNRVNSTALSIEMVTDDDYQEIADLLRSSVKEMESAVKTLSDEKLSEALKPEQRALNYLLKADAKNKEKSVQMSRQASQSGGSQNSSSEERMTELMDLELDISKDKYEIQQQSSNQQTQELNDALEKVRELASKQQQLANQSRNNLQEEDDSRFLDRLKRNQEELRQEAENLSNMIRNMSRNNQQNSSQMQEQVERITESMRQAEQDLKNNNVQEAMAKQRQALNDLNRLQQDMKFSLNDDTRGMLEDFTENFDQMKEREQRFAQDIRDAFDEAQRNNGIISDETDLNQLAENRASIIEQLKTLERQAQSIEKQTVQENPDVSTNMRNIQNTIKRENLERKMEDSKALVQNGWLSYSLLNEDTIQYSIEMLEEQIRQIEGGLPVTEEERLSRSLEDTRELLRRFEDIMAQSRQNNQENETSQNRDQQAQVGGQPNEQNAQSDQNRQQESSERQQPSNQEQRGQTGGQRNEENAQSDQTRQQISSSQQQSDRQQGGGGLDTDRNNLIRMQSTVDQFRQMLERMERDYAEDPQMRNSIESAYHSAYAQITGELLGENAENHFRENIFEPLSQIEKQLLKRLDELELEKKLYGIRKSEVPPEYKAMVDRYFESIAGTNK